MPSSAASTAIEAVVHYKKKLLRHVADENPEVILHCLTKLDRVSMTIDLLQETGIGRVVNSLKKALDAESRVAQIAKGIVTKWKDIVANHQEQQQEEEEEETEQNLEQERNETNDKDASTRTETETHSDERKMKTDPGEPSHSGTSTATKPPDEKRSSSSSKHKHKKHHKEKDAEKSGGGGSGSGKKHKKDKKESTRHHHHHKKEKRDQRVDEPKPSETAEEAELKTPSSSNGGGSSLVSVPNDINPNYRPASTSHLYEPLSTDYSVGSPPPPVRPCSFRRTEDEQLSALMSKKGTRNSMYSGVKRSVFKEVPTLKDICVLMLQENVDYIEQCGGLPFELLEPVLNRASPQTLMNIEEFNQYLMEKTGPLWERHCRKEFPKVVREEFESFREMYERSTKERAEKLEVLTAKMGTSYKKAKDSVRKTKLAYVDAVAKPPRSVKRAQERNGTASSAQPLSGKRGRPPLAGGGGGETRGSGHQPKKAKIAPMMAKSLKLARGLKVGFRR